MKLAPRLRPRRRGARHKADEPRSKRLPSTVPSTVLAVPAPPSSSGQGAKTVCQSFLMLATVQALVRASASASSARLRRRTRARRRRGRRAGPGTSARAGRRSAASGRRRSVAGRQDWAPPERAPIATGFIGPSSRSSCAGATRPARGTRRRSRVGRDAVARLGDHAHEVTPAAGDDVVGEAVVFQIAEQRHIGWYT